MKEALWLKGVIEELGIMQVYLAYHYDSKVSLI